MWERGFSLVELLIVVVIIGILVIIAIPMLRESKLAAESTAAMATLRFLSNAEEVYYSTTAGSKTYGTFQQMYAKGYLDVRFSSGTAVFDGYSFTAEIQSIHFTFRAQPEDTANPVFYITENYVLCYENGTPVGR
jgi:prepilin-type N-terminal cleavage/methylation domain-containing protein